LQFGGAGKNPSATRLQNFKTPHQSVARRAIQGAWCFSPKMRCVSFYFARGCPEQRPRAALKPQEPHSSGPWALPGATAEVLASRGVMESCGKLQAARVIFVVGKAVLTLHPPLRPLSHNANLRDGAQDIVGGGAGREATGLGGSSLQATEVNWRLVV
jgi:hypothetical protein